ncbi:MAG: hypothetical protein WA445_04685 [Pseudolabrys sp.]
MRFTQRTAETETERLERQQREREAMRQAIAAYTGPITSCPPGKTTWSWLRSSKGDAQVGGCGKLTAGATRDHRSVAERELRASTTLAHFATLAR